MNQTAVDPVIPAAGSMIIPMQQDAIPLPLERIFGATAPLEVDVGCGKGRFLTARAAAHPGRHFIGIEQRLKRVQKVDKKACRAGLKNVRVIYGDAELAVETMLPTASVAVYYISFSDPWPKRRHHERRVFNGKFMDAVHRTLVSGGVLNFTTDHQDYFRLVHRVLAAEKRFEAAAAYEPPPEEWSEFEITFRSLQRPIYRCAFRRL